MSKDLAVLTRLTENSTEVPVSSGQVENYVLLLVLLSVFAGGTVVLLSLLLLFCHRCCMGGRRYSRASDDLEKTNTTYAEDSQPTQELTIHLDESDALSAASCHDGESERFVSTGYTGRRVSFNESALYEKEKTTQSDKVRRYTLTEGDFHHLKKARLTHLHLPPAPCDLKILTIMECDSAGSSTNNISEATPPNLPVTIYQSGERRILDWTGQGLSGGLPGDTRHSTILEPGPGQACLTMKKRSQTMEAVSIRGETEKEKGARTLAPGQTSVLHFLSKLRRHASLEGAGPYFKRWKFDSGHRAASLDAKGSPKRRPFQRQRAASETTDHTDSSPMRDEVIDSITHTPAQAGGLQALSAESLSHRLNLEVGSSSSSSSSRGDLCSPTADVHAQRPTEASEHVTGEDETQFGRVRRTELTGEEEKTEAGVQERSTQSTETELVVSRARKRTEEEAEDESVSEVVVRGRADSGSSLSFMIRQESLEAAPSLYRDIWSLRASLEQYVSSDQSSTDHESVRSDADSVSSLCGAGGRSGLDSCLSQDLDDDPEGDVEADVLDGGTRGDSEVGGGAGGEAEAGNRKLLQMDSGYASIEAPSRAPEEMRLFGTPGAPRGKTASERRMFFTSSGRKGSVCESIEAKLFQEELEDEMTDGGEEKPETDTQPCPPADQLKSQQDSQPQLGSPVMKVIPSASSPHKPRLRRRDYSIDEKTDALFNEFLRHDPRFDQQDSPMRTRHRSRVHLRKQWQRHKQYSDPGSGAGGRYSPSLERQRFTPLRRGDSAGYPLDTRYHSTLSRIASAADEEASEVAACEEAAKESVEDGGRASVGDPGGTADPRREAAEAAQSRGASSGHGDGCRASAHDTESTISPALGTVAAPGSHLDPRVDNRNNNSSQAILSEVSLPVDSELTDKLVASVEERLYDSLRGHGEMDQVLRVSNTASPGFSPS